jgi:hypothetical protein
MKKSLLLILLALPLVTLATGHSIENPAELSVEKRQTSVKIVKSPGNRVVLLELYTSEGCSSCPPADQFLTELKKAGISDKHLIPLVFHVSYWDYIGWKDPFANKKYDARQRELAQKSRKKSVYTPQFVLSGEDYRSYASFNEDVNKLAKQKATVALELSARLLTGNGSQDQLQLDLKTDISSSEMKDVGFYLVIIENNLVSDVDDGENDGKRLQHDYVVRKYLGPYFHDKSVDQANHKYTVELASQWKRQDLSIVAFAENSRTGEVLQAVRLQY